MTASTRAARAFGAIVRSAHPADLDALVALEKACFVADRATRRAIRHALHSPTMSLLAAVAREPGGEVLVGAATLERRRNSATARLSSIAVSPARGGLGLGGLLLDAAESEARAHGCTRLRLEARTDNGGAIRLYERHGYARYAVKPDYYEDGATAWCYDKALPPA